MASENILHLTDETFEQVTMNGDKPVFVDFWATWCGPCRALAPIFEALAASPDFTDKVVFAKVDVDKCADAAGKMRIMSIPTLVMFKNGVMVEKLVGLRSEDELKSFIKKFI